MTTGERAIQKDELTRRIREVVLQSPLDVGAVISVLNNIAHEMEALALSNSAASFSGYSLDAHGDVVKATGEDAKLASRQGNQ